ncbi:DNA gyrase/topoisomerase IV subunit A [Ancylomarina longa]|uniref:DNA gyrase/topoisomerase IV subunit A n=1 Tax=Ancylomarina longa TaxID=2487017 RepID=A0A434AY02_9BACT|nr:DNA gyrase/topoisomerase IV subunit A [Ancylomarina longa]RUT79338.1 DNA gyrase/topoisomerase IV subunit A [Ancylomarina longa]
MSSEETNDMENPEEEEKELNGAQPEAMRNVTYLSGMYQNWFLDYASYVILERAVPYVNDGLKPVQRRILHAMKRLDDGRYNKVANIIGNTMQYHPHGDASIGDALVQLGQKDLLIDMQGNWGNILTGDSAAAPRYIEARLSKFALEVVFNAKTTNWKLSYDGRNKEPITLPVKFPLLLAQGVEGIAVGLASKILPHNFNELIKACIAYLREEEFVLYPDFPTAGMIEVSRYNDGLRGGAVKVRAKIEKEDNKTLKITQIPYGRNTTSLIDSIIKANDKGKIKIKKIDDNTAADVEIMIHLASGISSDKTIDALYAFTDCEISISPNACIIENDKPKFIGVSEILKRSADNTVALLKLELEIRKKELEEAWHYASLERIFIENKIYRDIEECETWESVLETIDKGLKPFTQNLMRAVTPDDIVRLTEIKIKRISKFDMDKAMDLIKAIESEIEEINVHIANIIPYTIRYFQAIKKKFGKGRERKTEIRSFENIVATKVVVANQKLYVNYEEGFLGTALKKDKYVCDCSDIDDVIIFRKDGTYFVTKVADKLFIGKNILHIAIFRKNDKRTIFNVAYRDGRGGNSYVKRFPVTSITRDKEYNLTKETTGSRVIYFSANPNGEAEVIRIVLKPKPRLKKLNFEFDFAELAVKGRASMGNILTRNDVHKITLKHEGVSTLGGRKIWFDPDVLRLNTDHRGDFIGEFSGEDKILIISKPASFHFTSFDLSNHYADNISIIEKYDPEKIWSAVFYDADQEYYYLKRFTMEGNGKTVDFIGENPNNKLICLTDESYPRFEITYGGKNEDRPKDIVEGIDFIGVKSHKARGKRLSIYEIKKIVELDPLPREENSEELVLEKPDVDKQNDINSEK